LIFRTTKHIWKNFRLKSDNIWFYVLFVLVLFFRKTFSFLNPQFWAEDSNIFFKDSIELGIESLIIPYAGYFHAIQRIVAYTASLFPLEIIPFIYNYASFGVLLYIVWFCLNHVDFVKNNKLIVVILALVPHSNEILLNLTNLHWYTSIYLGFLLLSDETIYKGHFNTLFTLICSLSGPFSIIILPFHFLKSFWSGNLKTWSYIRFALIVGAIVQALSLFKASGEEKIKISSGLAFDTISVLAARVCFMQKIGLDMFIKYKLLIIIVFVILNIILIILNRKKIDFILFYFYGISISFFSIVKFHSQEIVDLLYMYPVSDRYFFYFNFAFLFLCIIPFLKFKKIKVLEIYLILIFVYLFCTNTFFTHPHYIMEDYDWFEQSGRIRMYGDLRIKVNPPGWYVDLNVTN
jgi:hypothetical protein